MGTGRRGFGLECPRASFSSFIFHCGPINAAHQEPRPSRGDPHDEVPQRARRERRRARFARPRPPRAQWSNFIFFGDSLTDAGTYIPVVPPGVGRFTTNPDLVWAQVLGARYGFTITPANQGGTDYAQGGARLALLPGVPNNPPTATALPISSQVAQQIGAGIDPSAVYALWGGGKRHLLPAGTCAGRRNHVGAGAGRSHPRRHPICAAGRRASSGRRAEHRRVQPSRSRPDARRVAQGVLQGPRRSPPSRGCTTIRRRPA